MEDTSKEAKTTYRQMIMSLTEAERFIMCAEMFETAREIIISTMPQDLSEADQKRYIYQRLYGEPLPDDFPLK